MDIEAKGPKSENIASPELAVSSVTSKKESYDPYANRTYEGELQTNAQAFANLLKGVLGTGILALPGAFKNSGYVAGLISLVILALISGYTVIILFKAQYLVCKRKEIPILTYPESFGFAFEYGPKWSRHLSRFGYCIVQLFLTIYQTGVIIIYYLFCAESLKQITETWVDINWDTRVYATILIIPFMFIMCIRNLRRLAPFSMAGNFAMFVALIIVVVYMVKDGLPASSERKPFKNWKQYPLFIGTVSFAYCAIGVVVAVENNMKDPRNFVKTTGVWVWAILITMIMYCSFAYIGYMKYGDEAKGVVILNLPQDSIAMIAKLLVVLAIYESFALNAYYPFSVIYFDVLLPRLSPNRNHVIAEFLVRFGFVIFSYFVAVAIPHIDLLISLMGSLCLPPLLYLFPVMMDFLMNWPKNKGFLWYRLWLNFVLGVVSIAILIIGTYLSILEIYNVA